MKATSLKRRPAKATNGTMGTAGKGGNDTYRTELRARISESSMVSLPPLVK